MLGGAAAYLGPCTWRRALGGGAQHLGGAPLCIWRKTENCWKLLETRGHKRDFAAKVPKGLRPALMTPVETMETDGKLLENCTKPDEN